MRNSARWRGSTQLAVAAVAETTKLVAQTQRAVTARATRPLKAVPPLAPVTALVQAGIDATTAGVCATIQLVNHGVGRVLEQGFVAAAQRRPGQDARHPAPARTGHPHTLAANTVGLHGVGQLTKAEHAEGILNGLYGDFLHAQGNPLALDTTLRANGRVVAPTPAALASAYPHGTARLAVFVHGLGCTEAIWGIGAQEFHGAAGMTLGAQLHVALGYTPLLVRYNTGRGLADNGRLLAELLTQLVRAYPAGVDELVLVGHSMGGLIAHHALRAGRRTDAPWLPAVRHVVCVGTPHCGAPTAQAAAWLAHTLRAVDTAATQVGATVLDTRSAGIKDLRAGLAAPHARRTEQAADDHGLLPGIRYGFVGSTYADVAPANLAHWLGDLIVPLAGAQYGCLRAQPGTPDVWTQALAGVDHFRLANHPALHAAVVRELGSARA